MTRSRKIPPLYWFIILIIFTFGCQSLSPVTKGSTQPLANLSPTVVLDKDPVTMVLVPGGTFKMGSPDGDADEQPVHDVQVNAFYMDEAEVTCARYGKFLQETGYPPHEMWDPQFDRPEDPVVGVSWDDANVFAAWAGKQLPTEAQWEKAARGGKIQKKFPWGDDIDEDKANYNSFGTTPVKSYAPNDYGLYDMAGNVWEWCRDWHAGEYYNISSKRNPQGPQVGTRRVVRGGAWFCNPSALRVSNRYKNEPSLGSFNIGFRCVIPAENK